MGRRRKRSSWGTLTEVRRGVWRIRWREDTPQGRVRRSETFHGTRREAERRLAELRVATQETPSPLVGYIWSRHVLPALRASVERGTLRAQTLSQYESEWRCHVGPRWAEVPVTEVLAIDVESWLWGLTHATAAASLKVLRRVTDRAKALGAVQGDPLDVNLTLPERKRRDRSVPDAAALDGIGELVRGAWVEPMLLLCGHAGLRVGEAAGCQVGDLEWLADGKCVIHVSRQVDARGRIARTKTSTGHRYALMLPPHADRLREVVGALRPGAVWVMDDGASELDECPKRGRIAKQWARALSGTQWADVTMQRLRPAYETYMHWERGVPMEFLARLMGHASTRTTAANYDRPSNEMVIDAIVAAV